MNLGATPLQAFVLVTFPVLRPGIIAAFGFAFILSFDEVEMALFLASPRETPLTAVLYAAAQLAFDPAIAAVSALLIAIVFFFMVSYQVASGLGKRR
jgi:ABC-type spermidine/putrescine transport system permease subunit II